MRTAPFLATISLMLLAGCGSQVTPTPTGLPPLELVPIPDDPIEFNHDHTQHAGHEESVNMLPVAYDSGYGGEANTIPDGQGYSELFVRDNLTFLGRRGGNDGGFVIFDTKDPTHPKRLGVYQGLANYDMESTYDNRYVFYSSQYLNNQQPSSLPPDDAGEAPRVLHVIDIADPAAPKEAFAYPIPTRGAHTITYYRTEAGRELVAAQTYDFLPDPSLGLPAPDSGNNVAFQRVMIFDFLRSPQPHLELLSVYEQHPVPPTIPNPHAFPHDVAIELHPLTHKLLMYVAYWDLGGYIVDITDPTRPVELSRLTDFTPSVYRKIHLVAPADTLIEGMHVTVTEPEFTGGETETGQYTFFDTTDPAHPKRLGYWTLPGNLRNDVGTRFSCHNYEVENGRLYLAHYHAGVWIVDVHNKTLLQNPVALAFAQPLVNRTGAYNGDAPNIWTALYHKGYVFASDIASGLHILAYTGDVIDGKIPDPRAQGSP